MNTTSPDSPQNTCPKCGRPILEGSPRGLCPLCLISEVARDDSPPPVVPEPELDELRRAFPTLEIVEPLGAGGMGRVYKVRQPHLDRFGALKLLPPGLAEDPAWVERFTREARALARLNHPGIVQVYDFGEASIEPGKPDAKAFPFLLMEYVDGVNLRQALRAGSLSAAEALAIVPSICSALQYAHEQGVLHRDIKPENILLDSDGRVKIADFGVAKLAGVKDGLGATLTATGAQLGTAAYMAPEQIERPQDVDHRADIYSLGVVFYELLTGELPLGRFPAPSEKAGTDPRLDTIVFRTLEKERDRRFQSAGDVRTEVENVTSAGPPPMPVAAPTRRPTPDKFTKRVLVVVVAILVMPVVLILIGLILPAFNRKGGQVMMGPILVLSVLAAFATGVVLGLIWLFKRLQRGGASTAVAALIVALVLIIIPPIGCVAFLVPSYVSHRAHHVVSPPTSEFQLNRRAMTLSGGNATANWEITSSRPHWLSLQFGEVTKHVEPGQPMGGQYRTMIDASIVRRLGPNHSGLTVEMSGLNGASTSLETRFPDPPGDWINHLFNEVAGGKLYKPGKLILMHIGDTPLTLGVSTEKPALPDEAQFALKDIYFTVESNQQYMGVDYTKSSSGDADLYFKTEGLPEPTFGEHQAMVSGRPEQRMRHVWFFPKDLAESEGKRVKEQIESQYRDKTIAVPRGQLWPFFQVTLPDGKIGRVLMGSRKRSLESP